MVLTREKIEHVCERARRNLGQVERDLKPVFIPYRRGGWNEAVEEGAAKWRSKALLKCLKAMGEPSGPAFQGLVYHSLPMGMKLFMPEQVFAPIPILIDDMEDGAQVQHTVYHTLWHAKHLLDEFRMARKAQDAPDYRLEGGILRPNYHKFRETQNNLIADIFAAFMTDFEHKNGFLKTLALMRAQESLEKRPGFLIEQYPYPLVAEACQMVFEDLRPAFQDLDQLFPVAYTMAQEVAATYGDEVIQQWRDYALPAQEMVWLDYPMESVLGNAVFTAEDPYVRTAAYLICEFLDHTASPVADRSLYNPYASGDKSRNTHIRVCEEEFQRVLSRAAGMTDPSAFIEEMRRQNKALVGGNPVGWCAHAIIEASRVFEQCLQDEEMGLENVSEAFQNTLEAIQWDDILKVSRTIIAMHRAGKTFGLNEISAALAHMEGVEEILKTLRISVKSDFFEVNVSHVQRHKTMQTPINIAFGPGHEKPPPAQTGEGQNSQSENEAA